MSPLTVSAVAAAGELPRAGWERLAPAGHPFVNRDFLGILERHGMAGQECGWKARHLIARDGDGRALGILPLYVRANSHGDFIHDWSWAAAYQTTRQALLSRSCSAACRIRRPPVQRLLVSSGEDDGHHGPPRD
jgi:predicted N-acyltransferase